MVNATIFDFINNAKHLINDYLKNRSYQNRTLTNFIEGQQLDEDNAGYAKIVIPYSVIFERINNDTIDLDENGLLIYLKGKKYPKFVPDYDNRKEYTYSLYRQKLVYETIDDKPIELSYEGNQSGSIGARYFAHSKAASEPDGYYNESDDAIGFFFSNIYTNHDTPFYYNQEQLNNMQYEIEKVEKIGIIRPEREYLNEADNSNIIYFSTAKEFIDFFGNYITHNNEVFWLTYSTINYPEGYNLKFIHPVITHYFTLAYSDNVKGYWAYKNTGHQSYFYYNYAGLHSFYLSPNSSPPPQEFNNFLYFVGAPFDQAHFLAYRRLPQQNYDKEFVHIGILAPVWYEKRMGYLAGGNYYGATTYYVVKILKNNQNYPDDKIDLIYPYETLDDYADFTNINYIRRYSFRLTKANANIGTTSQPYYVFDLDNTNLFYTIADSLMGPTTQPNFCNITIKDYIDSWLHNIITVAHSSTSYPFVYSRLDAGGDDVPLYFVPRTFYMMNVDVNNVTKTIPVFNDSFYIKVGASPLSPYEAYVNTGLWYGDIFFGPLNRIKIPGSRLKGRKNVREFMPIMLLRNKIAAHGSHIPPSFSRSFVIPLLFSNYFRKTNFYTWSHNNDKFNNQLPLSYFINTHIITGSLYNLQPLYTNSNYIYPGYFLAYLPNNFTTLQNATDYFSYYPPVFAFNGNVYNTLSAYLPATILGGRNYTQVYVASKMFSSSILPANVHGINSHADTKQIKFANFYGYLDYWFFLPKNFYIRHLVYKYQRYNSSDSLRYLMENVFAPTRYNDFIEPSKFKYGYQSIYSEIPYNPIYYFSYEKGALDGSFIKLISQDYREPITNDPHAPNIIKYLELSFDPFDNFPVSYFGFEPFEPPNFTHANYALLDFSFLDETKGTNLGFFDSRFRYIALDKTVINVVPHFYIARNESSNISGRLFKNYTASIGYDLIVGYVYDLAGLKDMESSYYFKVDRDIFARVHKLVERVGPFYRVKIDHTDMQNKISSYTQDSNPLSVLYSMPFFNMFHMRVWPRPVYYYYTPTVSAPNPAYDVVDTIKYERVLQKAKKAKYVVDKEYNEDFFVLLYIKLDRDNNNIAEIFVWPENKINLFINTNNAINIYLASTYNIIKPILPVKKKYKNKRTDMMSIIKNKIKQGQNKTEILKDIISMRVLEDVDLDEYTFLDFPHPIESGITQGTAGWEINEAFLVTNSGNCINIIEEKKNDWPYLEFTGKAIEFSEIQTTNYAFYDKNGYTVYIDNDYEQKNVNAGWSEALYCKLSTEGQKGNQLIREKKVGLERAMQEVAVNGRRYYLSIVNDTHQIVEYRNISQNIVRDIRKSTEQHFIMSYENDKRNSKFVFGVINDDFYGNLTRICSVPLKSRKRLVLQDDFYSPTEATSFVERKRKVYENTIKNIENVNYFYNNLEVLDIKVANYIDNVFTRGINDSDNIFNTKNTGASYNAVAASSFGLNILPEVESIYNVEMGESHEGNDILFVSNKGSIDESDYVLMLYTPTTSHDGSSPLAGFYFLNNNLSLKSKMFNVHNIGFFHEFYNRNKYIKVISTKYKNNNDDVMYSEIPDSVFLPFLYPLSSQIPPDMNVNVPSFFARVFGPRIPVYIDQKFMIDELRGWALRKLGLGDNPQIEFKKEKHFGFFDLNLTSEPNVINSIIQDRTFHIFSRSYGRTFFPFPKIAEIDEHSPVAFLSYFAEGINANTGVPSFYSQAYYSDIINAYTITVSEFQNGNHIENINLPVFYFASVSQETNQMLDLFNSKRLYLSEVFVDGLVKSHYYRVIDLSGQGRLQFIAQGDNGLYKHNIYGFSDKIFKHRVRNSYNTNDSFFIIGNGGLAEIASHYGIWCSLLYSNYIPPIPMFRPQGVNLEMNSEYILDNSVIPYNPNDGSPEGYEMSKIGTNNPDNNKKIAVYGMYKYKSIIDNSKIKNSMIIYGSPGTWCTPIGASSYVQGYFTRGHILNSSSFHYALSCMPVEMIEPIDKTLEFKDEIDGPVDDKSFIYALARLNNIYIGAQKVYQMSPPFNAYSYVFVPYEKIDKNNVLSLDESLYNINFMQLFHILYDQSNFYFNYHDFIYDYRYFETNLTPILGDIPTLIAYNVFQKASHESLSLPQTNILNKKMSIPGIFMRRLNKNNQYMTDFYPFYIEGLEQDITQIINSDSNTMTKDKNYFYTYSTYPANRSIDGRVYYGMPFYGRTLDGAMENLYYVYNNLNAIHQRGYYRKYDKKIRRIKTRFSPFVSVSIGITFLGANMTFGYYVGEAGGILGFNLSNYHDKMWGHNVLPYYKILRKPLDYYVYDKSDNPILQERSFVLSFYSQPYLSYFNGLEAVPNLYTYNIQQLNPNTQKMPARLMDSPFLYLSEGQGSLNNPNVKYTCYATESIVQLLTGSLSGNTVQFFDYYFNYGRNSSNNAIKNIYSIDFNQLPLPNYTNIIVDVLSALSSYTQKALSSKNYSYGFKLNTDNINILYYYVFRYITVHGQENLNLELHTNKPSDYNSTFKYFDLFTNYEKIFNLWGKHSLFYKNTLYTRRFFTSLINKEYNSVYNKESYIYPSYHLYLESDEKDSEIFQNENLLGALHDYNFISKVVDSGGYLSDIITQMVFWFHNPDGFFFYHSPQNGQIMDVLPITNMDRQNSPNKIYKKAYKLDIFTNSLAGKSINDLFELEKENYSKYYILPEDVFTRLGPANSLIEAPSISNYYITDNVYFTGFANMHLMYNYSPRPVEIDNDGYIKIYNLSYQKSNEVPVPWRHFLYTSYVLYPRYINMTYDALYTNPNAGNFGALFDERIFYLLYSPVFYGIFAHKNTMIHGKYPYFALVGLFYKPAQSTAGPYYHTNCISPPPILQMLFLNSMFYTRTLFSFSLNKMYRGIFFPNLDQDGKLHLVYPRNSGFVVDYGKIAKGIQQMGFNPCYLGDTGSKYILSDSELQTVKTQENNKDVGGYPGEVHINFISNENRPSIGHATFYYFHKHKRQLTGMFSIINSIDYLDGEYGAPLPDRQLLYTHGGAPYYEALILDFMFSSGFFAEVKEGNNYILQGFALPHPNYIIAGDYDIYKAITPNPNKKVFVPEPVYSCPPMSFITSLTLKLKVKQQSSILDKKIEYNFFANGTIGFKNNAVKNRYKTQPKYYWEDLFANTCFPQCAWPVMAKKLSKYDYAPQQSLGNFNGGAYSGLSEIYNYRKEGVVGGH